MDITNRERREVETDGMESEGLCRRLLGRLAKTF